MTNLYHAQAENAQGEAQEATLPVMLSLKQAANLTGLSYYYLRGLCLTHEIVYIRCGNRYMVNRQSLADYLNKGTIEKEGKTK